MKFNCELVNDDVVLKSVEDIEDEIIIPSHVTKLGKHCFKDGGTIQKVVIPSNVQAIDQEIFDNCMIDELYIYEGISIIQPNTFKHSKINFLDLPNSIKEVYLYDCENVIVHKDARLMFDKQSELSNIYTCIDTYVDCVSLSFYKFHILEIDPDINYRLLDYYEYQYSKEDSIYANYSLLCIGFGLAYTYYPVLKAHYIKGFIQFPDYYGFKDVFEILKHQLDEVEQYLEPSEFDKVVEYIRLYNLYTDKNRLVLEQHYKKYYKPQLTKQLFKEMNKGRVNHMILSSSDIDEDVEELIVPEGIVSIETYCFHEHENIKRVVLSSTVKEIGDYAFESSNIETVVLNDGLTHIGKGCFKGCEFLKEIKLPQSLKFIGNGAFYESGIFDIHIPSNVEMIKNEAFTNCPNLLYLSVDSNNSIYDSRNDCNAIIETATNTLVFATSSTVIDSTIQYIDYYAFAYVNRYQLIIPSTIQVIREDAFYKAVINNVIVEEGVLKIEGTAFKDLTANYLELPDSLHNEDYEPLEINAYNTIVSKDLYIIQYNDKIYSIYASKESYEEFNTTKYERYYIFDIDIDLNEHLIKRLDDHLKYHEIRKCMGYSIMLDFVLIIGGKIAHTNYNHVKYYYVLGYLHNPKYYDVEDVHHILTNSFDIIFHFFYKNYDVDLLADYMLSHYLINKDNYTLLYDYYKQNRNIEYCTTLIQYLKSYNILDDHLFDL